MAIELGRRNPNLCCFTYHPGTVDTELSRPFTSRYTKNTIFSIEEAANYLLGVLQQSTPEHNGLLFDWNGDIIPF
jgi:hypothetical protein